MYELYPYFTNDGSVGLYSPNDDDIYHSTYGALSEAYEKFILPAGFDNFFKNHNEIKILDLCYGIGYNSKSFLNYFFENFNKKLSESNNTIGAIDTNNKYNKIYIKIVDKDKNLIFLSPFIKTNQKILFNNKINFEHEKISRFLTKKTKQKFKYQKFINIILLKKLIKNCPEILEDEDLPKLIKKYKQYLEPNICRLFNNYKNNGYNNTPLGRLSTFLHNIYYKHISNSYKIALRHLKLNDLLIDAKIGDARSILKNDSIKYNYIFLDAFTPAKCPALWTVEFFNLLNNHIEDDGLLLTYSNSAAVRNAMIQAGFWVGKIYDKTHDKYIGTIATKKLELIQNGLSEYDLGLINTKAGIPYRDENLTAIDEVIIANHDKEVSISHLQSSSKFIKMFRGTKDV